MSSGSVPDNDTRPEDRPGEDAASWFERLLATFGLGEEPDLRELIERALARSKAETLTIQE
ncbi:MAG: hypothetical protein IMZ46_09590, partial [Acidobacteria bacterium]|nr:hypothetical protein [Acidobacteriota bacterium]